MNVDVIVRSAPLDRDAQKRVRAENGDPRFGHGHSRVAQFAGAAACSTACRFNSISTDFEGERNEASALGPLCRLPGAIELLAVRLDRYVEGDRLESRSARQRAPT